MKKREWIAGLLLTALPLFAQQADVELPDPHPADVAPWQAVKQTKLGWGTTDLRYQKNAVPTLSKQLDLYAWRGERVNAQAVLLAPQGVKELSFAVSDLRAGKAVIPADAVNTYFVRYVLTDSYLGKDGKPHHDAHLTAAFDSFLVADRLDPAPMMAVESQTLRPMWMEIAVPRDAAPGRYKGTLTATFDGQTATLPFTLQVGKRQLPDPADWAFHLDLWQNPYAVARFHDVPLWSEAHFELMRPLMTELAHAGQKVITTSVIQHPWNSQTEDPFESMIGKRKAVDGSWSYDYAVFDRWVEFMMSCGITEQIDCYTIVPWHLIFEYYDEARHCTQQVKLEPGSPAYEAYLLPFLRDFAAHLKAKGWFGKTCIAMDERPKELLEPAYQVLYKADKRWKVKGAVNYFGPEVAERMYDISFSYQQPLLTPEQLSSHLAKGNRVTFYTCCSPARPNTFTFSNPAESVFLGWHAAAAGYSGYLRWAYNSWVKDAWHDSRFRTWPAGDCCLVYPAGSSIRMKRLVEGIQDSEKIRILRAELKGDKLNRLNATVEKFAPVEVGPEVDVERMVAEGRKQLRGLE